MKYQIAWRLGALFRAYVRHSPIRRGKGFLLRRAVIPLLPPLPASFLAALPGGGQIELYFRETLGYTSLIYGGFEKAELGSVHSLARLGSTAFDVGANVGMYAVVMAGAVGEEGSVIAVEPDPANVRRLSANLALNSTTNVRIIEAAAMDRQGSVLLHLAEDSAYHSIATVIHPRRSTKAAFVDAVRLDDIWHANGDMVVSIIKVDVEGAEIPVLEGTRHILATHHPALILEASGESAFETLRAFLTPYGYRPERREGYMPWNHLFVWRPDE